MSVFAFIFETELQLMTTFEAVLVTNEVEFSKRTELVV